MRGKVCHGLAQHHKQGGNAYYQRESSPPLGINKEQGRNCGDNLNGTVAQRCIECLIRSVADILEDGGTIEGDDCNMLETCNGSRPLHVLLMPHICWAIITVEAP
jgi:hypothetical protein